MRKLIPAIMPLVLLGVSTSAVATERCYNLAPFIDVLRLEVVVGPSGAGGVRHHLVYGNWVQPGVGSHPIVGSKELVAGSAARRIGAHATFHSGGAGTQTACNVEGIIDGTWELTCFGSSADPAFQNSGSPLAAVACAGVPPALRSRAANGVATRR